jgi:hypothetical protein
MKTYAVFLMVVILIFYQLFVNIGSAGHELIQYQSYYPHEIRFLDVDNTDLALKLMKNTTLLSAENGLHLYIDRLKKEAARINYTVKYLSHITTIYQLKFKKSNQYFQNNDLRLTISYGCINREELAKERQSNPLFIPLLPYHRENSYVRDFEGMLKTRMCTDLPDKLSQLKIAFVNGLEDLANKIIDQIKHNSGYRIDAKRVDISHDWDMLVTILDFSNYTISNLNYINGIYYGIDSFDGPFFIKSFFYEESKKPEWNIRNENDLFLYTRMLVYDWYKNSYNYPLMYDTEYYVFNDDYDVGLHNMAWSPLVGFLEPSAFFRTVKIKLFPWNGWLLVGSPSVDKCRFNPFLVPGDATCYGLWSVLSDPAFVLNPYNLTFEPNRVVAHMVVEGDFLLPPDSLFFDGGGVRAVGGERVDANVKVLYRVLLGPYHHGVDMGAEDVIYALFFMKKWVERDAELAKTAKHVLDDLRGVRVLNITEVPFIIPNVLNSTKRYLWVESYLKVDRVNFEKVAALNPPWTTLPWELLYLVDTALEEGRLSVRDLDLVEGKTVDILAEKLRELSSVNAVPAQIRGMVNDVEARKRWDSLMSWFNSTGNLVVTNGPYMLAKTSKSEVVLKVFRDPTYPLGIGSYDHLNVPRFARISKAFLQNTTADGGQPVRFEANVEVEDILFHARSYSKEFRGSGSAKIFVYLVDGAGKLYYYSLDGKPSKEGVFRSSLPPELVQTLPPGKYYLFIVPIPSYQYYSLPATTNYMNTTYAKMLLNIPERETNTPSMDAWLLPLLVSAAILAVFIFSRVRRR